MNRRLLLLGLVGVGAAGAGALWRWQRDFGLAPAGAGTAEAFLARTFERPDGSTLALSAWRGAPVLVNFWATWCPPCVREMPLLDRFHQTHRSRGWRVLGVAVDRPEIVQSFLARYPVSYDIAIAGLDGASASRDLGNPNGSLPFTVAFDARGAVVQRKLGEISEKDLWAWGRVD